MSMHYYQKGKVNPTVYVVVSWLNFINLKRNIVYHPSSGKTLSLDELSQLEEYEQWLSRKAGDIADGDGEASESAE